MADWKTGGYATAPISELPDRKKFVYNSHKGAKDMEKTTKKRGKAISPTARRYDEEFKAGAVRLVAEQKRPIKQAMSLGLV